MYKLKPNKIYASEIAEFLNLELHGKDFIVEAPCSLKDVKTGSVTYAKDSEILSELAKKKISSLLVICPSGTETKGLTFSVICAKKPRLDFIKVIQEFYITETERKVSPKANIDPSARVGSGVSIGDNSYIGPDVTIKANTYIGRNVVIDGKVAIGKNCVIKDNSTIGSEGFGFEYDDGVPIHFPQIGKIIIGDDVWVGSNSTIERPALEETIIEDHVKIDDLVQIGHNCIVGEGSLVIAGTILCGGVILGKRCWISPNVTIIQRVNVGDDALVGMGAVVLKDVAARSVVAGNPAKVIHKERKPEE